MLSRAFSEILEWREILQMRFELCTGRLTISTCDHSSPLPIAEGISICYKYIASFIYIWHVKYDFLLLIYRPLCPSKTVALISSFLPIVHCLNPVQHEVTLQRGAWYTYQKAARKVGM